VPRFLIEEDAAGLVEYALILGLVSITVIVTMVFMKDQLSTLFSTIGNTVGPHGAGSCQTPNQQGQCP
jgi:Flp pilus assembly pilin Flp